jgi:hypothetical protein
MGGEADAGCRNIAHAQTQGSVGVGVHALLNNG